MINIDRVVSQSDIQGFISRNGGSGKSFTGFAISQTASGKTKQEAQSSWLIVKGGSGKTLNDQWGTYLGTKGFTTGSLKERMRAFFKTGTQA